MRFDDWRTEQLKEIEQWAESIDRIITPSQIKPKTLHDYPECRALCDKLKRICQSKEKVLADQVQLIEDSLMKDIEDARIILKFNKAGIPEYKKKFSSASARDRELRRQLAEHPTYNQLARERSDWELMVKDWATHANKLRQEMRLLEADYLHNGAQTFPAANITGNI